MSWGEEKNSTNVAPLTWRFFTLKKRKKASRNNKLNKNRRRKMNFYKMLEIIQSKNEGRIVLCDLGCFYITSGSNALLLNKLLKLKLICQEFGVCKAGFPKTSLEKYTNILKTLEYSYIIYNFDKNNKIKRDIYTSHFLNNKNCSL